MTEGNVNKTAHRILKIKKKSSNEKSHPAFKDSNAEINISFMNKKSSKFFIPFF